MSTPLTPDQRRLESYDKRVEAAKKARDRKYWKYDEALDDYKEIAQPANHESNNDELIPLRPMSFTKGLPHNYDNGLIKSDAFFDAFVKGICSGIPQDFINTPLGPASDIDNPCVKPTAKDWCSERAKQSCPDMEPEKVRAWESAGAGLTFDLQGPDAQSVTMPPVPELGSDELIAEIAEVYAQALLRDIPFKEYVEGGQNIKIQEVLKVLNNLSFFKNGNRNGSPLNLSNAFRGFTAGDQEGPYLSQFLLTGTNGLNSKCEKIKEFEAKYGKIAYGSQIIDQKVRLALKDKNYLTDWNEWVDVQNGADFRGQEDYDGSVRRFITTPRDLAIYVHYDALYQAYLNACIILLDTKVVDGNGKVDPNTPKFDPHVPFQDPDIEDHQQGFAHYGGPHILTLVTEVATRALKAVRYQKFNTHRRLRPEALAARMHKLTHVVNELKTKGGDPALSKEEQVRAKKAAVDFEKMFTDLKDAGVLGIVADFNGTTMEDPNLLLPMAFTEGSPMHPSYGAGHATVAGACVTILKAFFNHKLYLDLAEDGTSLTLTDSAPEVSCAFVGNEDSLDIVRFEGKPLSLEGELNKLAANISIGRDWAGVHYYSDYVESLRLGEKVAIAMLEEQALMYNLDEKFYLTLPKFDGTTVRIDATGVFEV